MWRVVLIKLASVEPHRRKACFCTRTTKAQAGLHCTFSQSDQRPCYNVSGNVLAFWKVCLINVAQQKNYI